MFTPEELRAIELNEKLHNEIANLTDKANDLIEPLVKLVIVEDNLEKAHCLARLLPSGFHKLELKAWINKKMGLVN